MVRPATTILGALLLWPLAAVAGQQANPLPIYAADNAPHFVLFVRGGLIFEGHLYEAAGGGVFRTVHAPERCGPDEPGRQVGTLAIEGAAIRWTWTEYGGCGAGEHSVVRRIERVFSRRPVPEQERCTPGEHTYRRGDERLTVDDRCDGTLKLTVAGVDGWLILSGARGRYEGCDRFATNPPVSWKGTLQWSPGAEAITPKLTISLGDDPPRRLTGRWVRTP